MSSRAQRGIHTWTVCGSLAVLGTAIPSILSSQQPLVIRLDKPDATLSAEWTNVVGVRELPDGRLIVLDAREQVVKLVDMKAGTATPIGRRGRGPGEYQLPTGLFALADDTLAITDEMNYDRPVLISGSGKILTDALIPIPEERGPFFTAHSRVDQHGHVYRSAPLQGADGLFPIQRLDRKSARVDTVAYISRRNGSCAPPDRGVSRGPAATSDPRFARAASSQPAYAVIEEWAVSPDGWLAVACPNPYRVIFVDPAGKRAVGPLIPFQPVRLTEADKQAWVEERAAPVAVIRYGSGGQKRGGYEKPPASMIRQPVEWPEALPVFSMGRAFRSVVTFASDGSLWIERMTGAGTAAGYDVVNRTGRLIARVQLPPRSRVVGFGASGIYVVTPDADDIQRLHRFRFPPMNNR